MTLYKIEFQYRTSEGHIEHETYDSIVASSVLTAMKRTVNRFERDHRPYNVKIEKYIIEVYNFIVASEET